MRAAVYLSIHFMWSWFTWDCCFVEGLIPMHHHPKAPPFPSRLIVSSSTQGDIALKDVLGVSSVARKGSSVVLHLHVAVRPLSAMGYLLSLTINWIHFTAETKAKDLSSRSGAEPVAGEGGNGAQPDAGAANKAKCSPSPAGSACFGPALY